MTIAGILLAAGRSTRFGHEDKLAAHLHGRPLLHHAAEAMRQAPLRARFLVRSDGAEPMYGFTDVPVERGSEMSRSLAAGIAAARAAGADAALVALADMPFVSAGHLAALIARWSGPATLLCSIEGDRRSPPALFGADWFDALAAGSGDAGARVLIARAVPIAAPLGSLRDIDTTENLAAAQETQAAR